MQAQTVFGSSGSGAAGKALVYFAKVPSPGRVKTRLCPPLTPQEAAGLYRGFLLDVLHPWPGVCSFVYGAPAAQVEELAGLVRPGLELRPQRGTDLWQRLEACFAELFSEGFAGVVVRNTDSPDLPPARVDEALEALAPGRVVLGPDTGGGYYLVGLAAPSPGLFAGLPEGDGTVAARTAERARACGLEVHMLPEERDVDAFSDLLALWRARSPQGGADPGPS